MPIGVKKTEEEAVCACECDRPSRVVTPEPLCEAHYERWKTHGDDFDRGPIRKRSSKRYEACVLDGCDKPTQAHGLCGGHYQRARKQGPDFDRSPLPPKRKKWKRCICPGCPNPPRARGLCNGHYGRWYKVGETFDRGPLNGPEAHRKHKRNERCKIDGCRGGFFCGELICFLYARAYPPEQWSLRFEEAMKGMQNL